MVKMVRFARQGREKGGTVTPAQEAAIRADVTAKLAGVTYESGKPVFLVRDAKPFETKKGADFIVEVLGDSPSATLKAGSARYTDVVVQIVEHSGGHGWEPPGVFFAAGPDVDPKGNVAGIGIHDITPTLLYGMGLPIAEDFDGKVVSGLFTPAFRTANPVKTVASYGASTGGKPTENAETDEELLERLRSLGYIP
jgi:predicted AlkP superfamily phosphohydrolase/phosphomutase